MVVEAPDAMGTSGFERVRLDEITDERQITGRCQRCVVDGDFGILPPTYG